MALRTWKWRPSHSKPIQRRRFLFVEQLEDRTLLSTGVAISLMATPNDTYFGNLWGMSKIQAPAAWNTTTGSLKTVVADIDTGIDYTHPDLYKNVWINQGEIPEPQKTNILAHDDGDGLITFWDLNSGNVPLGPDTITDSNNDGRIDARDVLAAWSNGTDSDGNGYVDDLVGWNFVANNNNPFDDNGHGSHTAGTIAAEGNNGQGVVGVNWKAQIMPLKILDASGSGDLGDATDAEYYAARNGARVSNNSWGFYDSQETTSGTKYSFLYDAIKNTPQVLFVAAAGNNGLNNDTHWARNYPSSYNLSNIVAVAATTSNDGRASFSNYGSTTVDLGAPGVGIVSTVPGGYASYSGTSMATPHVAGAAALILAKNPTLDTASVKNAIVTSVKKTSGMSKTVSGGRLDVNAALAKVPAGASGSSSSGGSTSGPTGGKGRGQAQSQSLRGDFSQADEVAPDFRANAFFNVGPAGPDSYRNLPSQQFAAQAGTRAADPRSAAPAWMTNSSFAVMGSDSQTIQANPQDEPAVRPEVGVFGSPQAASVAVATSVRMGSTNVTVGTPIATEVEPAAPAPSPTESAPAQDQPGGTSISKLIGFVAAALFFFQGALVGKSQNALEEEELERRAK